jgi:hypothetical protein
MNLPLLDFSETIKLDTTFPTPSAYQLLNLGISQLEFELTQFLNYQNPQYKEMGPIKDLTKLVEKSFSIDSLESDLNDLYLVLVTISQGIAVYDLCYDTKELINLVLCLMCILEKYNLREHPNKIIDITAWRRKRREK